MNMETSRYKNYTKSTQQYMASVEKHLIDKYGKIENHWVGLLTLLATNYDIFIKARERVKQDGVMVTNRFGASEKHPMLKQITDSNNQVIKLVQEFGLSPNSIGKIKPPKEDKDNNPEWMENLKNDD